MASTTAILASAATTDSGCRIFSLPTELQVEIFDFAYPGAETRVLSKEAWLTRESQMRNQHGSPPARPYPGHKVNELFVSKLFFAAAAKAWIKNQMFVAPYFGMEVQITGFWEPLLDSEGLLSKYTEKIKMMDAVILRGFTNQLPRLMHVQVMPVLSNFQSRLYSDGDIVDSATFQKIILLRGILDLEMIPRTEIKGDQKAMMEANLTRLRELALPLVTLPRHDSPFPFDVSDLLEASWVLPPGTSFQQARRGKMFEIGTLFKKLGTWIRRVLNG
ncbi:Hypothetical predicted protein [Lecanosticta acicola]|uniref:Uncharacterized protein n=1 Tax=Lecanosticta acicola TaxID=111012 RepID=A0AAI9EG12_9PEZI|nr:Hypothetical predicted protein [Lecanosticta acicola]